MAELSQP